MPLFRRPTHAPLPLTVEDPLSGLEFPQSAYDYELQTVIGEGASSTVWLARCVPLDVRVAVKIIDTETPIFGKVLNFEDIRKEVHFWTNSNHPNIAPLYTTFISKTHVWFIMKYMPAGSCQSILQQAFPHGFEEPIVCRIIYEVLLALHYFHTNSHIHRDIKAGNILVDDKGVVQVTDFGVAGDLIEGGLRREVKTSFVGTPCWMAPEVILGKEQGYDTKADIWSTGITTIELATGCPPHINLKPMKIMVSRVQDPSPTLPKIPGKSFSTALQDLVAQCLIKDPEDRPSAETLLNHRAFKSVRTQSDLLLKGLIQLLPPVDRRSEQTISKRQIAFKTKHNEHVHNSQTNPSSSVPSIETSVKDEIPSGTASGRIYGVSQWNFGDTLKNEIAANQKQEKLAKQTSLLNNSTSTPSNAETIATDEPTKSGPNNTVNSRFIIEVDDDEVTDDANDEQETTTTTETTDTSSNEKNTATVGTLIDI